MLDREKYDLFLKTQERTKNVATPIFAYPELEALATNGRTAFFVGQEPFKTKSEIFSRVLWLYQLDEWAPALVADVTDECIASNGISKLHS